jgi:predicted nucleic acid-binding protein
MHIASLVTKMAALEGVSADSLLVLHAVETADRHQLSMWDAMIVAASAQSSCSTLLSDDLAPGAKYGGVEVVNPFRS